MPLASVCQFIRKLSQFHEHTPLVAWVQTQSITPWFTPDRRRIILLMATLAFAIRFIDHTLQFGELWTDRNGLNLSVVLPLLATFFGILIFLALLFLAISHFEKIPTIIQQHPQTSLHGIFWLIIVLIWTLPSNYHMWRSGLLIIGMMIPFLIWRCGYMVTQHRRNNIAKTKFRDHLLYVLPAWNGTHMPYGKGLDYLGQVEAKTNEAYAKSLLSGIKLLMLSGIWQIMLQIMNGAIYGDPSSFVLRMFPSLTLNIPRLADLLSQEVITSHTMAWLSLYLELISVTLLLAIYGHLWIGILRIAGFQVFRNTYKPLLAETIIDFWNRFHYYFKELLVEFFFFPAYLRYSWMSPKFRTFTAVFMAVFVGNMYYHLFTEMKALLEMDGAVLWNYLGPRMVYCLLLVGGIYLSMANQQQQRGKPLQKEIHPLLKKLRQWRRIAVVWTFYSMIHIWNVSSQNANFLDRADFCVFLFGFNT